MDSFRDNIYMITCPARTGSTMLVHLLRSHPDIISDDEVFSPAGTLGGMAGTYLIKRRGNQDFTNRMAAEKDRDPIEFLYKIVFDLQGRKAVSFKLKHDELVMPEYKVLRDEIVNDRDFRIIHLRRENLLRRYLSHYIANHVTRVTWAIHGQTVPELQPIVLKPHECQEDFETILQAVDPAVRKDADAAGIPNTIGDRYRYFIDGAIENIKTNPRFYLRNVWAALWEYANTFGPRSRATNRYASWFSSAARVR